MKQSVILMVIAAGFGLAVGWLARGSSGASETGEREAREDRDARMRVLSGHARGRSAGSSRRSAQPARWMPENERSFLDPQSEADRAEIRRLMRGAIEKEPNFHTRMKAVADLLALMTPENAHDIRDAFVNSRKDGFWYSLERKVFLARYGEVMGREALDEFQDDPDFVRALESWLLVAPDEAVDWVNELAPGGRRDQAINRLIGAFGSTDVNYAIEVFQSLGETEQRRHQRALTEAAIRAGGKENGTELALDLLSRENVVLQEAGRKTLQEVFDLYRESEEQISWLRGLPPHLLSELDQAKLPEEFRPAPGTSEGP